MKTRLLAVMGSRPGVRMSLDGLTCRPARVTLRAAPRNYHSLQIPAAPSS
jgi:hypothetical protein